MVNPVHRFSVSRAVALACLAVVFAAAGVGLAAAPATRAGARGPVVSAANKAAAAAEVDKAKELYSQEKFRDALTEAEKALRLDPTNSDALLLRRVLATKLAASTGATTQGATSTGKPAILTPAQVSMIRLLELPDDDRQIRGRMDRKVLDDFWENVITKDPQTPNLTRQDHDNFVNPTNFSIQAHLIKQSGQRKYMDQVAIQNDPTSMFGYKNIVHTYVMQNCATSECHGGDKAGSFRFADQARVAGITPEQIMYTDFFIMVTYAGKNGGKMIDRDDPDKSFFLQYSLPTTVATFPHPKVDLHKLPNTNDTRFRAMSDWIKTLPFPQPNYGIAFDLPGAATQPATRPATQPK